MQKFESFLERVSVPFARLGLFVVFFWFGILKVLGLSPATPLVSDLFEKTIHFMNFPTFLICFGIFECIIGVMFLIRGLERKAFVLMIIHIITTFGPIVFLSQATWSAPFVPTLEGQYIIKNLLIISSAVFVLLSAKKS